MASSELNREYQLSIHIPLCLDQCSLSIFTQQECQRVCTQHSCQQQITWLLCNFEAKLTESPTLINNVKSTQLSAVLRHLKREQMEVVLS